LGRVIKLQPLEGEKKREGKETTLDGKRIQIDHLKESYPMLPRKTNQKGGKEEYAFGETNPK